MEFLVLKELEKALSTVAGGEDIIQSQSGVLLSGQLRMNVKTIRVRKHGTFKRVSCGRIAGGHHIITHHVPLSVVLSVIHEHMLPRWISLVNKYAQS